LKASVEDQISIEKYGILEDVMKSQLIIKIIIFKRNQIACSHSTLKRLFDNYYW